MDSFIAILEIFVKGLASIFWSKDGKGGLIGGLVRMFNIPEYLEVIKTADSKALAILALVLVFVVLAGLVVLLIFILKRFFSRLFARETNVDLIDEIAHLRAELKRANKEKERILKLRMAGKDGLITEDYEQVMSLGAPIQIAATGSGDFHNDTSINQDESRFYKLTEVDKFYNDPEYKPHELNDTMTLPEICDKFRNHACSQMRLFYEIRTIRLFWASFATTRIVILQGISRFRQNFIIN